MFVQKLNQALEQIFQARAYEFREQEVEAYAVYWSAPSGYKVTLKQDKGIDFEIKLELDMYFDYQDGDIGPYGLLTAKLNDYKSRPEDKYFSLTQISRDESVAMSTQTKTCVSTNATLTIHIDYNMASEALKTFDINATNTEC